MAWETPLGKSSRSFSTWKCKIDIVANLKICHLSSCHPPFDIRILKKECASLAKAGYAVDFVVPHESGQTIEGVRIRAISKPRNRIERFFLTSWRIYFEALKSGSTLYHFHDPDLIPVGLLLKISGKKVIYDVHEDVPKDILDKEYLPRIVRPVVAALAKLLEKVGAAAFDGIVTATPSISRKFPGKKTLLVQNFPMLSDFTSTSIIDFSQRPYIVAYVGIISEIRGIRQLIRAMELLPSEFGAKLVLAGSFESPRFESEMRSLPGWRHVDYRGWQSREQVVDLLEREARVGIVPFHPVANQVEAQPNKIFEYMAAGLPVVLSNFPVWQELLSSVSCGLAADPLDPAAIAREILWLFEHPNESMDMGSRGKKAVIKIYNWTNEAAKLVGFYGALTGKRIRSGREA